MRIKKKGHMMRKHEKKLEKKHMKVLTGMFKSNMILSVGRSGELYYVINRLQTAPFLEYLKQHTTATDNRRLEGY